MSELEPIRPEELEAETGRAIPDKEVLSLLDLFVNVDLALDLAAPVDLAVAANANAALPIDASVTANVLSDNSTAQALSDQTVGVNQYLNADAIANAPQDATVNQGDDVIGAAGTTEGTTEPAAAALDPATGDLVDVPDVPDVPVDTLLSDGLLNLDVNVTADADLAAPIAGAVAANANVAAPIDASVAANIASTDSTATAIANQTAIINQSIEDSTAQATADQTAEVNQ